MDLDTSHKYNGSLKICILARKRLYRNTRVVRQAKTLSEAGHKVTVVALELPAPDLRDMTPEVRYIELDLESWPTKMLRAVSRLSSLPRRAVRWLNRLLRLFKRAAWSVRRSSKVIFDATGLRRLLAFIFVENNFSAFVNTKSISKKNPVALVLYAVRFLFVKPALIILSILRYGERLFSQTVNSIYIYTRKCLVPYINSALTRSFASEVVTLLDGQSWDFCQAHDSFALLAAEKAARKTGAKIIYDAVEISEDRSGDTLRKTPNWLRNLDLRQEESIIRSADLIFAIGPALAEWTAKRYGVKSPIIVRNCSLYKAPQLLNKEIRADLGLKRGEKLGIVIGNMYVGCGIDQLVESMKYINSEIHLAVLGVETQRGYVDNLKELIFKEDLENRIHILPPQPPHNVIPYAAGADFGVIALQRTSLNHECVLPNKVFEMIMARLPIVSSDLPNLKSLLEEHGIGLVFDERHPEDIASTINAIVEPNNYLRCQQALSLAAEELCWEKEGQRYVSAIQERAAENESQFSTLF
jgi:glycosyltransferase involved in cell wall biosynthesis